MRVAAATAAGVRNAARRMIERKRVGVEMDRVREEEESRGRDTTDQLLDSGKNVLVFWVK